MKDNAWFLMGAYAATDVLLFSRQTLGLEVLLTPMLTPKDTGYANFPAAVYTTGMLAWRAHAPVLGLFDFGYTGLTIRDLPNSNPDSSPSSPALYTATNAPETALIGKPVLNFDSQVHSGQASLTVTVGSLNLGVNGELAESFYSNPNIPALYNNKVIGHAGYLTGTAMIVGAGADFMGLRLKGTYKKVDDTFISAAAQGRSYDPTYSPYGPFPTENVLYNPQTRGFGGVLNTEPSETRFNDRLVPPYTTTLFGYLLPYDPALNNSSPYGLATPNRTGYAVEASADLLRGGLKPSVMYESSQQIYGIGKPVENYVVMRAGGVLDLKSVFGWPLKCMGGYRTEDTNDGSKVSFSSALVDLGFEIKPFEWTTLSVGGRHLDYNGNLISSTGSLTYVDQMYDLGGVGLVQRITEVITFTLNYSTQIYADKYASQKGWSLAYELDQGYAALMLNF
jgi:hypothetical protein